MDRSAAKAIVEDQILGLMDALGIPHWKIEVRYEAIPPSEPGFRSTGQCDRLDRYESASITIDPDGYDDPDKLRSCLRHELFHILLAPFDLYIAQVRAAIPGDTTLTTVLHAAEVHAVEKAVVNLERMFQGMLEHACKAATPKGGGIIPLKPGYGKKTVKTNIAEGIRSGVEPKQAVARAMNSARKSAKSAGKPSKGPKPPKRKKG